MNFEFTDDQQMLQTSIKNFLGEKYPNSEVRSFLDSYDITEQLVTDLANQGLLGVMGESEAELKDGLVYAALASYEAGRAILPFQLLESYISSYLIKRYTDNNTLSEQLELGKQTFTIGWNTKDINMSNETINGVISYTPFASTSNYMITNINNLWLLINLDDDKLTVDKMDSIDQTYPLYKITFDNYAFTSENILIEDESKLVAKEVANIAALLVSAEMIGGCEKMLHTTVDYTKEREQFGQVIAKFQAVKHQAAEMYLLLESSKVALKYNIWAYTSNQIDEIDKTIPLLKSYVSSSSNELIGKAIQLHGGIGFTWESDVHLYYKRARRSSVMYGDIYEHRKKLFHSINY